MTRRFSSKNLKNYEKFFQEYFVTKDDEGNYIVDIFFMVEIRKPKKIKYNLIYHNTWKFLKDGVMYKIFKDKLEEFYSKPISKELRSIIGE